MKVDEKNSSVEKMVTDWNLVTALLGGTRAMRSAGETYMPKRTLEESKDYQARLSVSTLYPAFSETVKKLTGRVFAKPIKLGDDIPSWIQNEVLNDIDKQGNDVHSFTRTVFERAFGYGLTHVLVDSPPSNPNLSQADQQKLKIRPYCVHVQAERVLGWKEQDGVLTQLRITGERMQEDEFGQTPIPQVWVYEVGRVRRFEKNTQGEWAQVEEVAMGLPIIPFLTFYTKRTGFMTAEPPLRELAFLNVKHWNKQSDSDELIHVASVPILVEYGGDEKKEVRIGARSAVKMGAKPECALEYCEHTGKAIEAGRIDLDNLKDEMREAGAKLLRKEANTITAKTATQVTEEAAADNSTLGMIVKDFENFVSNILNTVALWRRENVGGTVEAQPNLDPDVAPMESLKFLLAMSTAGKLSDRTLYESTQKRGVLGEDITWEEEQARIAEQPQPLAMEPRVRPGATGPTPRPGPTGATQ